MKLEVANMHWSDVYKDIARVPEAYRRDQHGNVILEGRICKVSVGGRSVLLSLRVQLEYATPAIYIDEKTRRMLDVAVAEQADFHFQQASWVGQFLWVWRASDPAYRIAARVGLASIILSAIGAVTGIVGMVATLWFSRSH